jgi:hypothetical protein
MSTLTPGEATPSFSCGRTVHGRIGWPWTAQQQSILDSLVDDKVTLCNRTLTRTDLYSIFRGEQLPKDRALCEALGIYY